MEPLIGLLDDRKRIDRPEVTELEQEVRWAVACSLTRLGYRGVALTDFARAVLSRGGRFILAERLGDLANPAFIAPLAEAFDADTGIDKIYEISGQPYKEYPTRQAARRALERIGGPEAEAALEERRDQRDEE